MTATARQRAALKYLTVGGATKFDSIALWTMYAERSSARRTAAREKAWKRISGSNMARMAEDGLLALSYSPNHRVSYRLTEAGAEELRA